MANHVTTNVTFYNISDEGLALLQKLYERVQSEHKSFGEIFIEPGGELTLDEVHSFDWAVDNIGPKWCHFEDMGEDYFILTSAWSYPQDGLIKLCELLEPVSEGVRISVTFQDEMPNFIGCATICSEGVEDDQVWEWEELEIIFKERIEGLAEEWDEENECFTEKGDELLSENMWEIISDLQSEWEAWN